MRSWILVDESHLLAVESELKRLRKRLGNDTFGCERVIRGSLRNIRDYIKGEVGRLVSGYVVILRQFCDNSGVIRII